MNHTKGGLVLFTANSHPPSRELGKRIAERLGVEIGKVQVYQEANRETRVQIQESVRGKDVFVIQTMSNKQCKMRKRGSIVSKLIACMMCKAGLTHLITMDLHQKEIQGFFNIPVDNLRASPFLLQYIQEEIPDYRNAVIVAKSPASAKRAQSFAERLRLGIAVIHGEAQDAESDQVDGRHSPPTVKTTGAIHPSMEIPLLIPKEKPPITVVGDVGGRIAIIVDNIIDDVDSFVAAAETLKERGAYKIFVMATHGILSCEAPRFIEEDPLPECEDSRGRHSSDMNHTKGGLVLFTANSHPPSRELGKRIAERLGVEIGKVQVYQEANRGEPTSPWPFPEIRPVVYLRTVGHVTRFPSVKLEVFLMVARCWNAGMLREAGRRVRPWERRSARAARSRRLAGPRVLGVRADPRFASAAHVLSVSIETRVQIQESVRGKDVFVIQTMSKDVNTTIMEMLIMVYACKTSCAKSITGVLPYFPYSKQCKMRKRGSIVSKLIACMMCKAGLTHLITMDLHQKEIQGFFNIPVDNLRASPFLLQYIQEEIPDYRNAVIVAKSPASAKRAQSFAERLRLGIAVIHGEAQDAESDQVDGRHSPPTVKTTGAIHPSMEIPLLIPKEKPPITVVGDVGGRIAIIVDDIIDDVDSFVAAAETLKERGAYKIFVMATHGILSCEAPRFIEESAIDEVGSPPQCRFFLVPHSLTQSPFPRSGGGDQHHPPRAPEAAVPQDQNGGHQHDPVGGHPPHPQWRVHVLPVPQHRRGRLTRGHVGLFQPLARFRFSFFAESLKKGCENPEPEPRVCGLPPPLPKTFKWLVVKRTCRLLFNTCSTKI
ncbi:unnamed protein product [Tetraodon nigroviridis]|uniref:Phosphoribosyl pyrophosphate synthase-associated protein 2 n=1 Tax=Tetraodon nigroviridis TaxID=99883 RepID=Q4S061_TETNG|nr:unnamed protein product [Tetraodon nigroviridis]